MHILSIAALEHINPERVALPPETAGRWPEKILQFGTGALLRGLPDYYVDQANRRGVFQGRIVAVKSTAKGPLQAFDRQDGLYTLTIQGQIAGKKKTEHTIISAISRVLPAEQKWPEVLASAADPQITVVLSNTTEAGIQLRLEDIRRRTPGSFPAKLLACLHQRYLALGDTDQSDLAVVPTELIPDNGDVLRRIICELAAHNKLDKAFFRWLQQHVHFCNSLVDRIIPGRPNAADTAAFEEALGYRDTLRITTEPYNLWAIEGGERVGALLAFHQGNSGMFITPDIHQYRETKLRLLNATQTLCSGMAVLAGIETVYDAVAHPVMSHLIRQLMLDEIALAIPYPVPKKMAYSFAHQTFARFANPLVHHRWINITSDYTLKLKIRVLPVLLEYYELYHEIPGRIALGFAAYLRFMKAVRIKDGRFIGETGTRQYGITDRHAAYFYELWKRYATAPEALVSVVLKNGDLWGRDLSLLPGFCDAVAEDLKKSNFSMEAD